MPAFILLVFSCLILTANGRGELLDDHKITIRAKSDIQAARRALVHYIWGSAGFPEKLLPRVSANCPAPFLSPRARRVDELRIPLAPGLEGLGYHFIPVRANRELVVVHHGHACTLADPPGSGDTGFGLQRTIQALLAEGYGVVAVFMPRMRPGDCGGNHAELFQTETNGSALKYFLEPTAASLNYLKTRSRKDDFPKYKSFHMLGLSGGGWTTTLYAAIDPTIRCSFPVAGSIPLYLRSGGSVGDREQFEPEFYRLASYLDLYILGSQGRRRQQVQILARRDDCCFGEAQHDPGKSRNSYSGALRAYECEIWSALARIQPASFRVEIDEAAPSHMISNYAIEQIILPTLRAARGSHE